MVSEKKKNQETRCNMDFIARSVCKQNPFAIVALYASADRKNKKTEQSIIVTPSSSFIS
jgi:hypothetical protein